MTNDLSDIFQVLILSQKYLIKTVDIDKIIYNLDIPSNYFKEFLSCLNILYQMPNIDLIVKQVKHDTDISSLNIIDSIEASKYYRHYGDGLLKKLIVALEMSARKHRGATKKTYFVRYNKQDYYRNISLYDNYYANSMAEALLMFRDNLLYLSKRNINIKYVKSIYPDNRHSGPAPKKDY